MSNKNERKSMQRINTIFAYFTIRTIVDICPKSKVHIRND